MEASLNLIIARIITTAAKQHSSDIHFISGSRPILRIDSSLVELEQEDIVTTEFIRKFVGSVLDEQNTKILEKEKNVSFVYIFENKVRIRVNLFYQKGTLAASLKLIPLRIPNLSDLGLAPAVMRFSELQSGIVVVSGPYGSGKTTTASALIEDINRKRSANILTIEKPIEFLFVNNKSIVEQREVGRDVNSFRDALNYCRQEDVDVILVGETTEESLMPLMFDIASGGRLVISIMDELTSVQVVEKILSQFPKEEIERARYLVAQHLQGIVAQRLMPRNGGGRTLAAEVLVSSSAIQALIEEGKLHQIENVLQTSHEEGMISLDQALAMLIKNNEIGMELALQYANDKQNLKTMAR